MKKLIVLLLIPVIGLSQKTTISVNRIFPKPEKLVEFEKTLSAHIQKYHTGDWKMQVFEVQTGPDAGAYDIVEGPNNWDAIEGRKEISPEHTNDWATNLAPLITSRGTAVFGVYKEELSSGNQNDNTEKMSLMHIVAKPGKISKVIDLIKLFRNVWQKDNQNVSVYQLVASGEPSFVLAYKLKDGLKEFADGYRKPMADRFNAANGSGSFEKFQADFSDAVESRWEELIVHRADLSSK